jgi:hypothetical protein
MSNAPPLAAYIITSNILKTQITCKHALLSFTLKQPSTITDKFYFKPTNAHKLQQERLAYAYFEKFQYTTPLPKWNTN